MAPITITTRYGIGDTVYVRDDAANRGVLVPGVVGGVRAEVMEPLASGPPQIYYWLEQTVAFPPPEGWWSEWQLVTRAEAQELAAAYHRAQSSIHDLYSRQAAAGH